MKKLLLAIVILLVMPVAVFAGSDVLYTRGASIEVDRYHNHGIRINGNSSRASTMEIRYSLGDLEYVEAYVDEQIVFDWYVSEKYGMRTIHIPQGRELDVYVDIREAGYIWVTFGGQKLETYVPADNDWAHDMSTIWPGSSYVSTSQVFLEVDAPDFVQPGRAFTVHVRSNGNRANTFEDYVALRPGNNKVLTVIGGEYIEELNIVVADEPFEFTVVMRSPGLRSTFSTEGVFGASQSVAELNFNLGPERLHSIFLPRVTR